MPSSVGMFSFLFVSFVCFLVRPSLYSSSVLLIRFFSLVFSLSFFPWFGRSSVHEIVPLYVASSDRSLLGSIVRLPSRSIVSSFDRSYDHSFVGPIICSPVRSGLRLSVCFFFCFCLARFIFLFVPPSTHLLFF